MSIRLLSEPAAAWLCLALTLGLYFLSKRLYRQFGWRLLQPLVIVPAVLGAFLLVTGIPYRVYLEDTGWLGWLLGPATIAFAVPIYERRDVIRRHWLALAIGVSAGVVSAVAGSYGLARLLDLSPDLQRALAIRSISTPFALLVSDQVGTPRDLTAVLVIITGLIGLILGELVLLLLPLRSRLARGALFGAGAHGVGTARARELGNEEGVVASMTMMIAGVTMVLIAPLLSRLLN
ncbi:LrgB family protein [Chitinasiproducens palmae]|uniref:Effector of murein hydrolase n=1 Tax=Chitinasiproducens palmae TaxID=1770053 RepID=A0A1H2PT83_9BURK|nr:LrgB family protein [Chitinasiproducens palmae]SDV50315.1 Putative effector of murein hydrolase [Chitinasiproducens palmae]